MFLIYDFFFCVFALLYFPYVLVRKKWHRDFLQRFGFFHRSIVYALKGKKNIWVHAVSVGEVAAVEGLTQHLQKDFPDHKIVFSTVTETGYKLALNKFDQDVVVIYAPLDFSWIVRIFYYVIRPKLYIATETEIWPNLFAFLNHQKVPIVLVNGRISNKAFSGYYRVRDFLKPVISAVNIYCMQSEKDRDRILALGANSAKVRMVGNIKFENVPAVKTPTLIELGYRNSDDVIVAGSTHPGEEEILLNVFKNLQLHFSNIRLVLAPRHIDRVIEVEQLIVKKGLHVLRYSAKHQGTMHSDDVLLVDTIGHLGGLYSIAKLVFVGKSLTGKGGQNIIEPAYFSKAIFVGPYTDNFKDVVTIFLSHNALIQVSDEKDLSAQMTRLLNDSAKLEAVGLAAKEVVESNRGALERTLRLIRPLLKKD